MKRLILLRHGKAVAKDAVADFDRVLAPRGRAQMKVVAEHLEDMEIDLALVSPSARTRETWSLAAREDVEARYDQRIYEAEAADLMQVLHEVPPDVHSVALVGHNPAFEDLARDLVQSGDRDARKRMENKYPTGCVAVLEFDIEQWSSLARRSARLVSFETPASLGFDGDD
jgi:phosphohistidine phosphatase